jgi:hypothetical protein
VKPLSRPIALKRRFSKEAGSATDRFINWKSVDQPIRGGFSVALAQDIENLWIT